MGATTKTLLTAEQFDNYPFEEDKRYELDEGEFVVTDKPAYLHNEILENLFYELRTYFRKNRIGRALISENLYALSPLTRRSPDVAVILGNRREELRDAKVIPIIPEIAAEVLSPRETPRMIQRKMKQYFEAGVKEVWIIHPKSLRVEIWTNPDRMAHALSGSDSVTSPLLPGFALSLDELFAEQP